MTQPLDLYCVTKSAQTMCHEKSGWDPLWPSMNQAGRVKPVERERRRPKSDRKRNSLASSRHQILLPECDCDCVARQQPMEERLPHFLIGIFVVTSRIVKRAKQFIPPTLFPTTLHQLGEENSHRVVVGNRKSMRMLSHGCTSILQMYSHWLVLSLQSANSTLKSQSRPAS